MNLSAAGPTVSATVLLALGALLLLAAWAARRARHRTRHRVDGRTILVQAEKLRQENRLKEARSLLVRAALDHRDDSAIHYRLACCHSLLGDFRNAIASLKRACDLDANWSVSAMHDPDLRGLWNSGVPGHRPSQWPTMRKGESNKAA